MLLITKCPELGTAAWTARSLLRISSDSRTSGQPPPHSPQPPSPSSAGCHPTRGVRASQGALCVKEVGGSLTRPATEGRVVALIDCALPEQSFLPSPPDTKGSPIGALPQGGGELRSPKCSLLHELGSGSRTRREPRAFHPNLLFRSLDSEPLRLARGLRGRHAVESSRVTAGFRIEKLELAGAGWILGGRTQI